MTASELTVIVKDDEKTLSTKFLLYEEYKVDEYDPVIQDCIQQVLKNFDAEPTDVIVKITFSL